MQAQLPPNRLAELRAAAGLKLYDVSAKIRVDPATVHRWERGKTSIPDEQKFALAALFDVSVSYLMGWDDPKVAA